jgi:KDO2-lipid IV(A) lauroyltransferase
VTRTNLIDEMKVKKNHQPRHRLFSTMIIRCWRFVPAGLRRLLFTTVALSYYQLFPRHRLIALYNLTIAFPEKGMTEKVAIAKRVYRNIALVGAELFDIPSLTSDNIHDIVEVEGIDHCRKALEQGRGILLFSAHFGNWELSAAALSFLLKPLIVVYRPLDNAVLDDMILQIRSATGNTLLPKERSMRQMLRHLQQNSIVGILIDQNMARQEGVFIKFFSRIACTSDAVAQLALRTKAAVIPSFALRTPQGKYRLLIGEAINTIDTGDWDADVLVNTQNYTNAVEAMVRRYPDQWLWVHHRWKTKPWQVN